MTQSFWRDSCKRIVETTAWKLGEGNNEALHNFMIHELSMSLFTVIHQKWLQPRTYNFANATRTKSFVFVIFRRRFSKPNGSSSQSNLSFVILYFALSCTMAKPGTLGPIFRASTNQSVEGKTSPKISSRTYHERRVSRLRSASKNLEILETLETEDHRILSSLWADYKDRTLGKINQNTLYLAKCLFRASLVYNFQMSNELDLWERL